ncbi:MAG TPA: uroporphyrinogen decarboxylase [Candidatus Binataceae bacterium]|nr:uroporphyrinogen decarboxylase [Candidatus Binataceae bacterium]
MESPSQPNPADNSPAAEALRMRIVAFESRMAAEAAALITRGGGVAIVAPAMREVPLGENPAGLDFAERLLAGEIDVAIFLTGVGTRALFQVMESRRPRADLVAALGRTVTVVRGPKPARALRDLGIEPTVATPEPNTSRELLAALAAYRDLRGARVAVQEYGVSNRDLIAGLEARGAQVSVVPVYRWTMPTDLEPLRAALRAIVDGRADAAIFTSSHQVTNVMQIAQAGGIDAEVRHGLAAMAVGSIGPVCSEELRAHGIAVDFEPAHPRLGHLVKDALTRAPVIVAEKRRSATHAEVSAAPRISRLTENAQHLRHWDHPMLRACRREPADYTPVWLMRQAGRYMPEYRRVRDQHDFLELCMRPQLAAEITVTTVERLGVDAAIIFADILLPLIPMDVGLHYEKGDGPIIDRPIRTAADLDRVPPLDASALGFVAESIKLVDRAIGAETPIIGFAGAPFTLASYVIEGGTSRQYQATKTLMYNDPDTWHRLMDLLARVTIDYLNMQVAAGASIVQLFDSWVGSLGPDDYRRFVLPHTASIIEGVKPGVPVIHFGTITGNLLELMREAGGDVIGLDWRVDLAEAWKRLGYDVAVQGNLDPIALFAPVPEIRTRARAILDRAAGRPGHIFNLGHGILPDTPVDHVIALVDAVHELSRRDK